MVHTVVLPNGHVICDDRERIDMEMVLASLAGTYWAADRSRDVLARSWANCLPMGIYAPDGKQVGFGRVLTDYALRAISATFSSNPTFAVLVLAADWSRPSWLIPSSRPSSTGR